jgi:flagella synthesis protein FlgN
MTSPITTLRDEQQLITSLVDLMKQEQQFLVSADSDGLNTITPQKSALVQQAAALASQRQDDNARALWLALLERTREAKELNRVNGMLITKQMTNTQVVLNAMRTPTGAADTGVYGPGGQTSSGGPSRRFVVG